MDELLLKKISLRRVRKSVGVSTVGACGIILFPFSDKENLLLFTTLYPFLFLNLMPLELQRRKEMIKIKVNK